MVAITEPGVYDLPANVYHADPVPGGSLSSSGARRLLATCPAKFRHEQQYPPTPSDEMDLGTAAHKLVLGVGPEIEEIKAKDWRTKAAQTARDQVRAEGKVPLLSADYATVQAMAAALRTHPLAGPLFRPERGTPEQALIWRDGPTGVWRRALVDHLPHRSARPIVADYKTTADASPDAVSRSVAKFGYHMQAAFYLDGFRALGLGDDPAFVLVFQEKTPPYLVNVVELDERALEVGAARNRRALEIYRDCREAGVWPGYGDDVALVSLPAWADRDMEFTS